MLKKIGFLLVITVMLVAPGCKGGDTETPYPQPLTQTPDNAPRTSYPVAPTAAQLTPEWTPIVVPEPGADTGVVTGYIFETETGDPMAFTTIYLAMKVFLTPGPGYTINIMQDNSPHSLSDGDGRFALENVPPGDYVLMAWSMFGASVVMDTTRAGEMLITVKAGEVVDVGKVQTNALR
ncbi:hypothetical protein ACFLZW_01180 [Chloroflexota bacterium]